MSGMYSDCSVEREHPVKKTPQVLAGEDRVIVIFLDGVGIGEPDLEKNLFFQDDFQFLRDIFGEVPHLGLQRLNKDGVFCFPVDAVMGVDGFPQSGTGQISLLCGINAQKKLGMHFGPYPHSQLRPVLEEKNIFRILKTRHKRVAYLNAFPKVYFEIVKKRRQAFGAIAYAAHSAGLRLGTASDVRKGKRLTGEITNARWNARLGYRLQVIKPETAAGRLLKISREHHFVLYEYFLTDYIGHGRVREEKSSLMQSLSAFLTSVVRGIDEDTTLIIFSDHGNAEDLSLKHHTMNPAIGIAAGRRASLFAKKVKKLSDYYNIILTILE